MACAASEKVGLELGDNDKECSICHELFTHPKLLPCAHVMCRQCILTWLSTNQEPVCPLCRCAIADTKQGKQPAGGWEKAVEELPDDVAMAALVECTRLLRGEHVCVGCRQSSAVSVCLHCGDMLCGTCTTAHANLSATRHHKVENMSTMTAEKLCVSQPASCSEHADRASELYCPKHGAAICHLCASSVHRACPEVILFDKRVQELKEELVKMSQMLKTAEQNMERAIHELDNKQKEAEQKTTEVMAQIDQACNRLENSVKACRKRLKELALQFKNNVEKSVGLTKATLLKRQGRMISHRNLVDRVQVTSPPGRLEQVTTLVRLRVSDVNVSATTSSMPTEMSMVRVDSAVVTRLERELSFLGEKHTPVKLDGVGEWRFYPTSSVTLTNGRKTAERQTGSSSIVVSDSPMQNNVLYEVVIDEVRGRSADTFPCGVVGTKPEVLYRSALPSTSLHGWKEAIVFSHKVIVNGEEKDYDIGSRLRKLKQGTRVGFALDSGGFLHLYINGEKQWIFVRNAPRNCYIFFDLMHVYRKITCLPPTSVKKAMEKTTSMQNLSKR